MASIKFSGKAADVRLAPYFRLCSPIGTNRQRYRHFSTAGLSLAPILSLIRIAQFVF